MTRYGMVVDVNKCTGCYSCFVACRDEHCGNDHPPIAVAQPYKGHFWLRIVEKERGQYPKVKVDYTAVPCMHCDCAPCIEKAESGAVYKRPDGIVIIDPEKAMQDGAPVIHDEPDTEGIYDSKHNIVHHIEEEVGDVEAAFATVEHTFEGEYRTPKQQHTHLEPHVCITYWDEDDRLVIRTSTQVPFHIRRMGSTDRPAY